MCPPRAGMAAKRPGVDGYVLRASSALDNVERVGKVDRAVEVDCVDSVERVAGAGLR